MVVMGVGGVISVFGGGGDMIQEWSFRSSGWKFRSSQLEVVARYEEHERQWDCTLN